MLLPHQEGFRHRSRVVIWTTALCLVGSVVWPDQSPADRLLAPLYGLMAALLSYGLFRLFLTVLAMVGEERFPRLTLAYILFGFYGGILGTALGLIVYPFQWHTQRSSQMPASYYIASLPTGLFLAAAALAVLKKFYESD